MTTQAELRTAIRTAGTFDGSKSEREFLDKVFGDDWSFSLYDTEIKETTQGLIVMAKGDLHFFVEPEVKKVKKVEPDADAAVADNYRPMRSVVGVGVAPYVWPYNKATHAALTNTMRNALAQLGAAVVYDEGEKPAPSRPALLDLPQQTTPTQAPNVGGTASPAKAPDGSEAIACGDCGAFLEAYKATTGKWMSVDAQNKMTTKSYGHPCCRACNGKRYKASKG